MRYEALEQHLRSLGAATGEPVDDAVWRELGPDGGAYVPDVLRWLFGRFAGSGLACAGYADPTTGRDVPFGFLLGPDALLSVHGDTREVLPDDVVPIEDDSSGNHLAVGVGRANAGQVFCYVHDAFLDENLYRVHDALEPFLFALHPLTDEMLFPER